MDISVRDNFVMNRKITKSLVTRNSLNVAINCDKAYFSLFFSYSCVRVHPLSHPSLAHVINMS